MQSQDVRKQSSSTANSDVPDARYSHSHSRTYHRPRRSQYDNTRSDRPHEQRNRYNDERPSSQRKEFQPGQKPNSADFVADSVSPSVKDEAVAILIEMGFSHEDAANALVITNGDIEAAAVWITNSHRSIHHSHAAKHVKSSAVKFRVASSVQLDNVGQSPLPSQSSSEWIQQQLKQQTSNKSVRLPKSVDPASSNANDSNKKSFIESRKQQELKDNLLSMQRTKQYLLQQDSSASPSTVASSSRSLHSASPDVTESDLDGFVGGKAESFAQMFGHYSQEEHLHLSTTQSNEWLETVRTRPHEAVSQIEQVLSEDFICKDPNLLAQWKAMDVAGNSAIHICCQHNHVDLLKLLLRMRVSPNTLVESPPPTHTAADFTQIPLSTSLASDSDSDSQSQKDQIISNQHRFVFDVNALNHHRISAVHLCCRYGYVECLRLLLERFALLDVKDARGFRPLHAAAAVGDVECMKLLIEESVSQRIIQLMPRTKSHQTPLHLAALFGHLRAVTYLHRLQKNALYIKDKNQNTLLHYAVGWPLVMEYIMQCDKSGSASAPINSSSGNFSDPSQRLVNALNSKFESALRHCLDLPRSLCEVCMTLLLSFDASTDPFACRMSAQAEIVFGPFDISKIVNPHPRNRPNALRKLVRQSIELDSASQSKKKQITTVLHEAARKGQLFAVQLLVTVGKANVECVSHPQGNTPLHYACRYGHLSVVEFLLRAGSSALRLNKLGFNALMVCAKYAQLEIIQRIIHQVKQQRSNEDNIHTMREYVSNNRDSCFSLALQHGCTPIVRILIREGMYHFDKNQQQILDILRTASDNIIKLSRVDSCVRRIEEVQSVLPSCEVVASTTYDVKLMCDQTHLYAHRCILAGRSEYFSGMLRQISTLHSTSSAGLTELHLPHLSCDTLRTVLQFLYTGTLNRTLTASALIDLLLCANELLLPTLLQCCLRIAGANGYLSAHGLSLNSSLNESAKLFPSFQELQSIIAPQFQAHLQSCTPAPVDSTNHVDNTTTASFAELEAEDEWESKEEESDRDAEDSLSPTAAVASSRAVLQESDLVSEPLLELDGSFLQLLRRCSQPSSCADVILAPNDITQSSPNVSTMDGICGLEDEDEVEGPLESNSSTGVKAHRVILSLASARLAALCETVSVSSSSPPTASINLSSSCLRILLNCIYGHSLCLAQEIESVGQCARALAAVPDAYPSSPFSIQDVIDWIHTVHEWINPTSLAFDCFQQQLVVLLDTYAAYYTQVPANLCELFFACAPLSGSYKLLFMKLGQIFVKNWSNLCDWNDQPHAMVPLAIEDVEAVRRSELEEIARLDRWNAIRGLVHRFHQQNNSTCCDGAIKYDDLQSDQVYACLAMHVFDWRELNLQPNSSV